jgi:hypothetical protein
MESWERRKTNVRTLFKMGTGSSTVASNVSIDTHFLVGATEFDWFVEMTGNLRRHEETGISQYEG